ncbi:MAG: AbrB/MazE/SpoVT family DNA-binding domain-containing protein [Candidatus Omnitrophica bacterium]|nr:AbrB/MazE/SpoVT family DNA-binding domain-containing protein [Candidatus Omnitrophota bacterium]
MIMTSPKSIKLWGRGQLTLPKELRTALKLDDDAQLNIFAVGQCLILTPKRLTRTKLTKEIKKSAKKQGITFNTLLKDLKKERQKVIEEKYEK